MDPLSTRIPARSKRQAMDWSLVLASQGIEPTIDYAENDHGWGLLVEPQDYERALAAIRQYRVENRNWPWQQSVFEAGVVFDWSSLAWVALLCFFFWLTPSQSALRSAGEMDGMAVAHGQWWRLFTAVWLHADLGHLAGNATIGVLLLGLCMGRYGTGIGLLAAYLAGAGGNVLSGLLAAGLHRSLGASGMVMGCLGLLAVQSLALWRPAPQAARLLLAGVCGGLMLFLLLGLAPGSDIMAHAGGFLSGVLLGAMLSWTPHLAQKTVLNFVAGVVFVVLVLWPWWLALSHL